MVKLCDFTVQTVKSVCFCLFHSVIIKVIEMIKLIVDTTALAPRKSLTAWIYNQIVE